MFMLMNSRPPTISGVALKLVMVGGNASRHRSGSRRLSSSKMRRESACHSPPPSVSMLRKPVGGAPRPRDFEVLEVLGVDLVERRNSPFSGAPC